MVIMGGMAVPEYRWLLPAILTVDPDDGTRPVRRSTRDWIVDTICFILAAGIALLSTVDLLQPEPVILTGYPSPDWLIWIDLAASLVASVALWWRRRWPVGLALATVPLILFSAAASVALMIILFTVAVHRRFVVAAAVAAIHLLGAALLGVIRPDNTLPYWAAMVLSITFIALVMLWGMFVRARRQLVVSLRDRPERAESEQQLRVAQARALERTRIAREMHDVLAHRISLLSLHAGALEIRPDSPATEVAGAAGVIRASAHQALQDLREVIGVLREVSGRRAAGAPAAHPGRPAVAGGRVPGGGHAGPPRRAGRRAGRGTVQHRAHGLPDRPGGADQRPQTRPGSSRDGTGRTGRPQPV